MTARKRRPASRPGTSKIGVASLVVSGTDFDLASSVIQELTRMYEVMSDELPPIG
jgi:hypothetical protein